MWRTNFFGGIERCKLRIENMIGTQNDNKNKKYNEMQSCFQLLVNANVIPSFFHLECKEFSCNAQSSSPKKISRNRDLEDINS